MSFNNLFVTYSSMSYCCRYETMISCLDPHAPRVEDVQTALCNIEKDSLTYLRNLFVKKRQPGATHLLLFLLSDERRNRKPYTMPIQYVPYKSIRNQFVRDLTVNIKTEMMRLGLKPVGRYFYGNTSSSQDLYNSIFLKLTIKKGAHFMIFCSHKWPFSFSLCNQRHLSLLNLGE